MASFLNRTAVVAAMLVWLLACGGAAGPDFHRVEFQDGRASMAGITLQLSGADDPKHPTAWEGPLQVAGRCKADLSLLTAVYISHGARYLVATTYNGALRYAHFVDVQTCKELWPPRKASRDFTLAGDDLAAGQEHWQLFPDQAPRSK